MIDLAFNILFVIVSLYIFLKTVFYAVYEIRNQDNKAGRNWAYCIFCDCFCIFYCSCIYEIIKRKNERGFPNKQETSLVMLNSNKNSSTNLFFNFYFKLFQNQLASTFYLLI